VPSIPTLAKNGPGFFFANLISRWRATMSTALYSPPLRGPTESAVIVTILKGSLRGGVAGDAAIGAKDADGFATSGVVRFTSNTNWLQSESGYMKTALHEVGHLMGLEHFNSQVTYGSSVMKAHLGKDDNRGNISTTITPLDARQACLAQFYGGATPSGACAP